MPSSTRDTFAEARQEQGSARQQDDRQRNFRDDQPRAQPLMCAVGSAAACGLTENAARHRAGHVDIEILESPLFSFEPGLTALGMEAARGGAFEVLSKFHRCRFDEHRSEFEATVLALLRDYAPSVYGDLGCRCRGSSTLESPAVR